MKVFKFGGASIKDAQSVQNVAKILNLYKNKPLIVVVSALGKTTNLLEKILKSYFEKSEDLLTLVEQLKKEHFSIVQELGDKEEQIGQKLEEILNQLLQRLQQEPSDNFDYEYDKIVSFGELLSTNLISLYLNKIGIRNRLLDARKMIKTDHNFREGKVDWEKTTATLQEKITPLLKKEQVVITQGFIAGTLENIPTTLGREGSDYSAAIIAFALNAESVTIWKDVPGLLNADPKFFPEAVKLKEISYEEAIELAYYGATIIHPKTIKPLQNKNIPLFVKSFFNPTESGSKIGAVFPKINIPSYIFKRNQILITVFPKDFSFIAVDNLKELFALFSQYKLKINLMQNSALSFSICADNIMERVSPIIEQLQENYIIKYNNDVELITVRHYTEEIIEKVVKKRKIYIEQKNRTTTQLVVRGIF